MKNAWKGALLSGLVFPGLGEIVLGRFKRGLLLIGIVLAGLVGIVAEATIHALAILEKIEDSAFV